MSHQVKLYLDCIRHTIVYLFSTMQYHAILNGKDIVFQITGTKIAFISIDDN